VEYQESHGARETVTIRNGHLGDASGMGKR